MKYNTSQYSWCAVRSDAKERTSWRTSCRLYVHIFRLCSYHVLMTYSADFNGPKYHKNRTFSGRTGTLLCFQARHSSTNCSSTSDLTVLKKKKRKQHWPTENYRKRTQAQHPLLSYLSQLLIRCSCWCCTSSSCAWVLKPRPLASSATCKQFKNLFGLFDSLKKNPEDC